MIAQTANPSRACRRASAWLLLWSCAAAAAFTACSSDKQVVSPPTTPGAPAYWESERPSDPERVLPERMPNPGSGPISPQGSTDKFLWQDGVGLPGGPEAQSAMRDLGKKSAEPSAIEGAVDKVDGGSDGGSRDGGP